MCVRCSRLVSCSLKHNHRFPLSLPPSSLSLGPQLIHPYTAAIQPSPSFLPTLSLSLALCPSLSPAFYNTKNILYLPALKWIHSPWQRPRPVVNLSRASSVFQLAPRPLVEPVGRSLGWWIWVHLTRWFRIHSRTLSLSLSRSLVLTQLAKKKKAWPRFTSNEALLNALRVLVCSINKVLTRTETFCEVTCSWGQWEKEPLKKF